MKSKIKTDETDLLVGWDTAMGLLNLKPICYAKNALDIDKMILNERASPIAVFTIIIIKMVDTICGTKLLNKPGWTFNVLTLPKKKNCFHNYETLIKR